MTTLILADDHAMLRDSLRSLLHTLGRYQVLGDAGNGDDALRLIMSLTPDVAVLDLSMPGKSGIDLGRELKQSGCSTRLVLMTQHATPQTCTEAIAAGFLGIVAKEDAVESVASAIDAAAKGESYLSPKMAQLPPVPELAPREREVLGWITQGKSTKDIAAHLGLSPKTVDTHRTNMMNKIGAHSVADVIAFAQRTGLGRLPS
jgi:DNA-binding NarL/FixJ family response regulator